MMRLYANLNSETKYIFKNVLKARSTPVVFVFKHGKVHATVAGDDLEALELALLN